MAILLVLTFHLRLLRGGSLGVDVFFVLSGFLITTILAEEYQRSGGIRLRQFYLRRILRLVPALAVLLLLFLIHTLLFMPPEVWNVCWLEAASVASYTSNLSSLTGVTISNFGYTWSLSVEEQFYLLWPACLYVMLRKLSRAQILGIVAAGVVASAALRVFLHRQHQLLGTEPIDLMRLYSGLDTRADSLLSGCFVGLLASWGLVPTSSRFVKGMGVAALVAAAVIGYALNTFDMGSSQNYDGVFTLVAISVAVILLRLLAAPARFVNPFLESAPMVGIGRISYGLYLYHMPIFIWIETSTTGWLPARYALAVGATFAAALLSYFLIERPFLRLKDRLQSASRPAADEPVSEPARRAA